MAARPVPPLTPDPVIEALKKDVDRTLLRENLALTPEQRLLGRPATITNIAALLGEITGGGTYEDLVSESDGARRVSC